MRGRSLLPLLIPSLPQQIHAPNPCLELCFCLGSWTQDWGVCLAMHYCGSFLFEYCDDREEDHHCSQTAASRWWHLEVDCGQPAPALI